MLAQSHYDRALRNGANQTIPREVLDSIRPTLKRINDSKASEVANASYSQASSKSNRQKSKENPRAAKAEVVFDVTSTSLQKDVIESPVPVLLDVYADVSRFENVVLVNNTLVWCLHSGVDLVSSWGLCWRKLR